MKQRAHIGNPFGPATARRLAGTALLLAAVALAGCGTVMNGGGGAQTSETDDSQFAASPANISSLSAVIQRNPNDPRLRHYRVRGASWPLDPSSRLEAFLFTDCTLESLQLVANPASNSPRPRVPLEITFGENDLFCVILPWEHSRSAPGPRGSGELC